MHAYIWGKIGQPHTLANMITTTNYSSQFMGWLVTSTGAMSDTPLVKSHLKKKLDLTEHSTKGGPVKCRSVNGLDEPQAVRLKDDTAHSMFVS